MMFASLRSSSRRTRSWRSPARIIHRLNFDRTGLRIGSQWNRADGLLAQTKEGQPIGLRDL